MLNAILPFYKLSHAIIAGAASLSLLYQAAPLHAQPTSADLSLGRGLALALLVTGILADDPDDALATDHLALGAHCLDAGSNLHCTAPCRSLC